VEHCLGALQNSMRRIHEVLSMGVVGVVRGVSWGSMPQMADTCKYVTLLDWWTELCLHDGVSILEGIVNDIDLV
jgi:hypothetical protein